MVMYYFEDIEKQKELKIILDSWVGTPYKHKIGVKGMGCDCIHFVARVLEELKILDFKYLSIPDYPRDWHIHNTREILSEAIEKYLDVNLHTINDDMLNGDIILSHYGKASSHAGIYFDGYIYQAMNNIRLNKINFSDKSFKKHMKFVYRIKK